MSIVSSAPKKMKKMKKMGSIVDELGCARSGDGT
jgi:hypothetical protein